MARMDIEDQFWLDLMCVIEKMGDQDKAAGNALRFLRFSQEQHRKGKLLSEGEFRDKGFHESLLGVFAERVNGGIRAIGAKKHFGWLEQKIEAGSRGGQKSAKRPRDSKGRLMKTPSETKRRPSVIQAKPSEPIQANPSDHQPTPTLSLSSSLTSTNTHKDIALAVASAEPNPVKVYCDSYLERYGHSPEIGGKQAGILARFAKGHRGKWERLIRGYLLMPDSWAVARSHPVELLESKVNEVVRFLETGRVVTKKVVEHAEALVDKAQGTNRKPRRSIEDLERERAEMLADAGVRKIGGEV